MNGGWIGVDLDGTLAHYDRWVGPEHIGEPVLPMLDLVRSWVEQGCAVRIFTARVSPENGTDADVSRRAIQAWCATHVGTILPVTHEKDFKMSVLYDDRCVQVEKNTGRIIRDLAIL